MGSSCMRLENSVEVSQHVKEANGAVECREFFFDKFSCCYLV